MKSSAKTNRIDLGLAILSAVLMPDSPLPSEDIAAWCGCSKQAIMRIERKALRKVKARLSVLTQ